VSENDNIGIKELNLNWFGKPLQTSNHRCKGGGVGRAKPEPKDVSSRREKTHQTRNQHIQHKTGTGGADGWCRSSHHHRKRLHDNVRDWIWSAV
jgi:hypothetical protein